MCEGKVWSCFAMTEPEVAGSDPTLIKAVGYQDGEEWVITGHKWFISNAKRANFAILVARTEDDPDMPQAANTAFIVDLPNTGWLDFVPSKPCTAAPDIKRALSKTCGSTNHRCSAGAAKVTCSGNTGSALPGWPIACGGSPKQKWHST